MQIYIGQRVKLSRKAKIEKYAKKHDVSENEARENIGWIAEFLEPLSDGALGTIKQREIGKGGSYTVYVDFDNHKAYGNFVCGISEHVGQNLPEYLLPLDNQ